MELDFNSYKTIYDKYETDFLGITKVALKALKLDFDPIISVSLIDNETIRQINNDYRHIDKETDVISFAFIDAEEDKDIILHSKKMFVLGDIYISVEKAITQAKEIGNSIDREILFLFTHGLLHLLGYDHMNKAQEEIMFPLQEEILYTYMKKEANR